MISQGDPDEPVVLTIDLTRAEAERILEERLFRLTVDDEIQDVVDCTVEGDPPENVYHYAKIGTLKPQLSDGELTNVVIAAWNATYLGEFDHEGQPLHDYESWDMTSDVDRRRVLEFAGILLGRIEP